MPATIGIFLIGLAVVALASLWVAAPLFRSAVLETVGPDDAGARARWERQKRQALAGIKEAEMDHRMGKLSDGDLATLRARLETQALEAMAEIEKGEG